LSSQVSQLRNSYIERFNRTYREEVLDLYLFNSLTEVRDITRNWLRFTVEQHDYELYLGVNGIEHTKTGYHPGKL